MAIKRVVDIGFWTDGKVDEFSPEDKYFMLYLLTNPFSKQLGIYELSIKQAAFQMGYSVDAFNVLLDRFENKYKMIRFSRETNEVAIINFLRHSVMKGGKPVEDCIKQDMARVKNKNLIGYVFSRLYSRNDLNATVRKIVDEYINENGIQNDNDKHNDNDNDNDNDRTQGVSYHDSYDESFSQQEKPKKSTKKTSKPTKHKHGEYFNVLLTDEELEKLQTEYFDWEERIERLSSYIASTGKAYKSHYATIRNWARKDAAQTQRPFSGRSGGRQTKAEELDDFYAMAADWAKGD